MIGTLEVKCCAAQPQKPLPPCFSFLDSPQSFRIIEVPKAIGTWEITGIQVSVQYPDNTNLLKDATRVSGNVYVATFEGSSVAGKVTQGYKILANGIDEQGNEVTGYKLGIGDIYVMECDQDVQSLVEKHSLRLCEDIPSEPSEGDALLNGQELKIYDGTKWITISGGGSGGDTYTKEEIDEMVSAIDSSISELGASVSALDTSVGELDSSVSTLGSSVIALDSSVSTLGSSLSVLSASVSSFGEDLAVVNASVSSLTSSMTSLASQVTRLSSSMTSLASTKRDKTDRVWKYTRETDTEMYGVQKFQVANDTISETYDLEKFNSTTKVWSMYEGQATPTPPPTVKAYSYALYAVIDENNPHTFVDDDEIERQGWPFYRTSDTNNSWLISAGDYEYSVRATPRADTSLALDDTVAEKRDYEDLSWKYPMDKDPVRFGVQSFEITYSGNLYNLNSFTSSGVSRVWAQSAAPYGDRFEITATSAHDFTLRDKVTAKTTGFTRLNDNNNSWELQNGQDIYIVLASKRKPATLAIYEPNTSDPEQVVLDFGQSSAGLVLGTNLDASTQAFITLDDITLTGTNYVSSRGAQTRGATKRDATPHLKVNGETVAFTSEIEGATSSIQSEISEVSASVSAMASSVGLLEEQTSALASRMGEVAASVETMGSSVSGLTSSVSAMASSIDVKRDYYDLNYGGTYDPSDAEGYYGITSWNIAGIKVNGQTVPAFNTAFRGNNNPTYGTYWNNNPTVIYTSDFSTFYITGVGSAEPVPFTLSLNKTTYEVSFEATVGAYAGHQDIILTANLANGDKLTLNSQLSAYATTSALESVSANVSALGSQVSAMTSSFATLGSSVDAMGSQVSALASSMSAKRDYLDLTYSYSSTSTVMQSILDPLYKYTYDWEYNRGGSDRNPWGITAMTITFPSEFVSNMQQELEDFKMSLPEGYSALPSTYDLEWVEDEFVGEYRWMPTGSIVSPDGSTWKEYFMNAGGVDCFNINTNGIVEGEEAWQQSHLSIITGMSWTLEGSDIMGGELSADITINGTRSEYKDYEDRYPISASNFYNISAEPTNFTMTWQDYYTGDAITGSATITPIMPTSTSTVTVSDSLALANVVSGQISEVTAQVSSMASVVEEVASSVSALAQSVGYLDEHIVNAVDPALSDIANKRDYYSMGLECFQDEGHNTFHTDVARLGINAITFEFDPDVPSGSPSIYNLTSFSWIQEADPEVPQNSIARWYSPTASESRFYVDAEVVDAWTVNFNIYDSTTSSSVEGAWNDSILWDGTATTTWKVDGSTYDTRTTLSMVSTRLATMQDLWDEIGSVMNEQM